MTNRSEINRALAKALAYAECGKFEEAQRWGEALIRKLELAAVFKAGSVRVETAHKSIKWTEIEEGAR